MIDLALDGIYMYSIVCELKEKINGGKISKINQPEKDEISLTIRSKDNMNYKLLISASSSYPKIHLTENNKVNPLKAPMFCMILRKYLQNSRIIDIKQVSTDRIIIIDVQSSDEMGFNSVYSLIVEVMGRHSNITLVRQRDNLIMDSIKHITPEVNRYRSIYPGIPYIFPPKSEKLSPFEFSKLEFNNKIETDLVSVDDKMFFKLFTGVSKPLSKEIYFRYSIENNKDLYAFTKNFFDEILNAHFNFAAYYLEGDAKEFYCVNLKHLENYSEKTFKNASSLIEYFYFEKDKNDRLNNHSVDLQRIVHTNIDRCNKKEEILNNNLKACEDKEQYKLFGELITANIFAVTKGLDKIELQNYYSENLDMVSIKLNPNKSASLNAQSYYKKYVKLKKTEEMSLLQLESNNEEINYLQSVLTNIINCETYEEIEEIKKELIETGYIKFNKKNKDKKAKVSKPHHFISSDGIDIYVGKNNFQNDYLTLKFADKRDIWMHTKNIPGSHVIIKNNGNIPDKTLEEAAGLAAYYSKAKHSINVPVDYTEVKNIKKPSGGKPGMVIYYTNKTINIIPKKL
jgi:predicted ribosome quality control (RQC) complex YloA/Tae2 family protein